MKVVIIGGGTAGITTATHLRRLDENAEIVILEKDNEFAVSTCGLPYLLAGIISDPEDLSGATVEQMRRIFKITVKLQHEVVNINRREKKLILEDGTSETYDKLVLATGALQLRPDIDGILGDNIFTLRDLRSVERIRDYYLGTNAQKVVILGAGDIGLEAAEAFKILGADVSLIEGGAHILPRFDADMAAVMQNHLRDTGIRLFLGQKVKRFDETKVILEGNAELEYDLALIATGTKPDVKLPIMADLEIGESGGIKTDCRMRTNDPDIYACGDNVEIKNLLTGRCGAGGNAETAVKQARVAADNLAGKEARFTEVVGTSILKCMNLTIAGAGLNEKTLKAAGIAYRKVHLFQNNHAGYLPDVEKLLFKLLFSSDGKILGIQGIGKTGIDKRIDVTTAIMRAGGGYEEMINAEIAYAPPFSGAKDIINNLGSLAEGVIRDGVRYAYIDQLDWEQAGSGFMLIDTRSPEAFRNGHITGAVNFPLAVLRENLASIPRDKPVILYCNYGYGAYNAYCILSQRGYDNVHLLSGSMDLYTEIMANSIPE